MSPTGGGNLATEDGNPAPVGQESPVDEAEAWVASDPRPQGVDGDAVGAAGISGAAGALGQEVGEPAAGLDQALEGLSSDDSDIGPADEVEENMPRPRDLLMDGGQIPLVGLRFVFLDLVRSLLYRISYNHHLLVRPRNGRMQVRPRSHFSTSQLPMLPVPEGSGEGAMAQEAEGREEGAMAQELWGPAEGAVAQELWGPGEGAVAQPLWGPGEGARVQPLRGPGMRARFQPLWGPREGARAQELWCPEEGAVGQELWGPGKEAMAQEAEDQAETEVQEEPAQEAAAREETSKCQYENSEEEAQDAESKEEETECNKKQEGPKKDVDPEEKGPGKPSMKE